MEKQTPQIVSFEEAAAFAERWGFKSLRPADMEDLREAMNSIAQAGRTVPRVASKFDQPAAVFHALPKNPMPT